MNAFLYALATHPLVKTAATVAAGAAVAGADAALTLYLGGLNPQQSATLGGIAALLLHNYLSGLRQKMG